MTTRSFARPQPKDGLHVPLHSAYAPGDDPANLIKIRFEMLLCAVIRYGERDEDRVPSLAADLCSAFAADGCVVTHVAEQTSGVRVICSHTPAGRYPAGRIDALLGKHSLRIGSVQLVSQPLEGGPAILARGPIGYIILYRNSKAACFGEQDALLVQTLWRNCHFPKPSLGSPEGGDRPESNLSPRGFQVLSWLLHGRSEKQIASQLGISHHTVHVHVRSLYRRLKVNSRSQLFARCQKHDDDNKGRQDPIQPV